MAEEQATQTVAPETSGPTAPPAPSLGRYVRDIIAGAFRMEDGGEAVPQQQVDTIADHLTGRIQAEGEELVPGTFGEIADAVMAGIIDQTRGNEVVVAPTINNGWDDVADTTPPTTTPKLTAPVIVTSYRIEPETPPALPDNGPQDFWTSLPNPYADTNDTTQVPPLPEAELIPVGAYDPNTGSTVTGSAPIDIAPQSYEYDFSNNDQGADYSEPTREDILLNVYNSRADLEDALETQWSARQSGDDEAAQAAADLVIASIQDLTEGIEQLRGLGFQPAQIDAWNNDVDNTLDSMQATFDEFDDFVTRTYGERAVALVEDLEEMIPRTVDERVRVTLEEQLDRLRGAQVDDIFRLPDLVEKIEAAIEDPLKTWRAEHPGEAQADDHFRKSMEMREQAIEAADNLIAILDRRWPTMDPVDAGEVLNIIGDLVVAKNKGDLADLREAINNARDVYNQPLTDEQRERIIEREELFRQRVEKEKRFDDLYQDPVKVITNDIDNVIANTTVPWVADQMRTAKDELERALNAKDFEQMRDAFAAARDALARGETDEDRAAWETQTREMVQDTIDDLTRRTRNRNTIGTLEELIRADIENNRYTSDEEGKMQDVRIALRNAAQSNDNDAMQRAIDEARRRRVEPLTDFERIQAEEVHRQQEETARRNAQFNDLYRERYEEVREELNRIEQETPINAAQERIEEQIRNLERAWKDKQPGRMEQAMSDAIDVLNNPVRPGEFEEQQRRAQAERERFERMQEEAARLREEAALAAANLGSQIDFYENEMERDAFIPAIVTKNSLEEALNSGDVSRIRRALDAYNENFGNYTRTEEEATAHQQNEDLQRMHQTVTSIYNLAETSLNTLTDAGQVWMQSAVDQLREAMRQNDIESVNANIRLVNTIIDNMQKEEQYQR